MAKTSKIKEACELMWLTHATIWAHYDPDLTKGDELQPEDIKRRLKEIEVFVRENDPQLLIDAGWDELPE